MERAQVYNLIDGERDYQKRLRRNTEKNMSPLEQLSLIEVIVADMKRKFYSESGPADMGFMRKIAGVAVRAMEEHGAPARL
jgi:hypothetical protein